MKTLLLNRSVIQRTLTTADYFKAVEDVHARHARGEVIAPGMLHADAPTGEYHIKTGGLAGAAPYFGLKANGGFFGNAKLGLPSILGMIYLTDAGNGYPLAIMDSVEISRRRTAAATAVAAKYLAPAGHIQLGVVGTGTQAFMQAEALCRLLKIERVNVWGRDEAKAIALARQLNMQWHVSASVASSIESLASGCNVLVTTTPSTSFLIKKDWIQPGAFIAAVGADSPGKCELEPALTASAKIVADITSQVIRVGETQNAIREKLMTADDVYAEIGELIIGKKKSRENDRDIFIYDSTGTALQDVAVAALLYERLKDKSEIPAIDLFA